MSNPRRTRYNILVMYILIAMHLDSRKDLKPKYGKHSRNKIYPLLIAEGNFDLPISFLVFELYHIFKGQWLLYISTEFNIQQFHVLPTQHIYVFCVDLSTNSHYFPTQHEQIGFSTRDHGCLLSGMSQSCI